MKEKWFLLILMIISVPIAGELNFYPFRDEFRVSLGTPTFFLFLLWLRTPPPLVSGLLVGISVTLFRTGLQAFLDSDWNWSASFHHHYPVFFYYLTYGIVFTAVRMNRYHNRPLIVGFLGVSIEIAATSAELLFRYTSIAEMASLTTWNQIALIAFFRSFFVLGIFNIVKLRHSRAAEEQKRKENEKMIMLISELYEESIQLKKTLHSAEYITRVSYELYQSLKDTHLPGLDDLSQKALRIAGQVHEIKKDNQRIYAGLSGLISHDSDYLPMDELAGIVLRSNEKYARSLGKKIAFSLQIDGECPLCHVYAILSLLNNLVTNAVEAIRDSGYIRISVIRNGDDIVIRVIDSGPGIAPKYQDRIFMPGFTTKYDESGNPSTGIGLAYVKQEVELLHGTIRVQAGSDGIGANFIITLPVSKIGKEE